MRLEQGLLSNCIFKFPVFPCPNANFPCAIICDYYIHKTDWADLSHFWKKWDFLQQILQYPFTLESGNLQLEQTKFAVFSLTGILFGHFPCFTVQWGSCPKHGEVLISATDYSDMI